ncbi:MAG: hypothetical protein ACJA2W_000230 [Planctomycetota bacterium]|jgi:hypothetical protein
MMNVGTLKTFSYLTSFALLGGIGYNIYDFWNKGQHEQYFVTERAKDVLTGVEEPRPPTSKGLSYQDDIKPAVVDFDWTGAPPPPPADIVEAGTEIEVEELDTPVDDILDVIAIIAASDDPAECRCLIRMVDDTKAENSDFWLYIGDSLPEPHANIAILDIKPATVTFSFADDDRESESIRPHARSDKSLIAKADKNGIVAPRRPSLVSGSKAAVGPKAPLNTEKKNGQFYIGTDDAERFAQNYDDILSRDISSETHYDENGKRDGVKITRVSKDSIAAQHGLQDGDIIKSINGHSVSSKQEAISFAKKNSERYEIWQVEIENLGRSRIEVYHSPEN